MRKHLLTARLVFTAMVVVILTLSVHGSHYISHADPYPTNCSSTISCYCSTTITNQSLTLPCYYPNQVSIPGPTPTPPPSSPPVVVILIDRPPVTGCATPSINYVTSIS